MNRCDTEHLASEPRPGAGPSENAHTAADESESRASGAAHTAGSHAATPNTGNRPQR
jgi:hypothetical protein